jgi:hypothetical protein
MESYYSHLRDSEKDREEKIRTVRCPRCGAKKKTRCKRDGEFRGISCTGRYNAAADAELVPAMPGMWGLQEPSRMVPSG